MNIYRNNKTGRLVTLYEVRPRIAGSWLETEDYFTGESRRLPRAHERHLVLVGQR